MKKIFVFLLCLVGIADAQVQTKYISVTPTVDTNAYAAKDNIGGLMTFNLISCLNKTKGRITSVMLSDKSDNAVEYDLLLFKSLPSGTFTDQAATDPTDADLLLMLPVINLASTDHFSLTDNGITTLSSLDSGAVAYSTTSLPGTLYVALVARAATTYAGTSDVTVTLGFTCD